MRIFSFSKRTFKEILRDPLTLVFGLGFPSILIVLLSVIQSNIPVSIFEINKLVPGMTIFGLSFMTLFSATLIAKDRENAFLTRLYATPMKALDFILGYSLPIVPIALAQGIFCYIIGFFFGLKFSINILYSIIFLIPVSVIFIGLGLMFGSILTQKQVGGICGALLTNLTAWLSGIWFDLDLVGGVFKKVAEILPFYHAVKLEQMVFIGDFNNIFTHLFVILIYMVILIIIPIFSFLKQMKK